MGCPLHVRFFIFLFVHFVYCLRVWLFWLFACVGASLNGQRVTENSEIRVHRHREREGSLPLNRPKGNVKSKKRQRCAGCMDVKVREGLINHYVGRIRGTLTLL